MKHTYITPATDELKLQAENSLLVSSIEIEGSGETVNPEESWSTGKEGWNAEDWSETDGE